MIPHCKLQHGITQPILQLFLTYLYFLLVMKPNRLLLLLFVFRSFVRSSAFSSFSVLFFLSAIPRLLFAHFLHRGGTSSVCLHGRLGKRPPTPMILMLSSSLRLIFLHPRLRNSGNCRSPLISRDGGDDDNQGREAACLFRLGH